MPRPSLAATMLRLAELRTRRDHLASERRRVAVPDKPDRALQLAEIDAERLEEFYIEDTGALPIGGEEGTAR